MNRYHSFPFMAKISPIATATLILGSQIMLGPATTVHATTATTAVRLSAAHEHGTAILLEGAGKRTAPSPLLAYETKGSFAQWAMATFAHQRPHSILPKNQYRDVSGKLLLPLGQAVALGIVQPDASRYFGVQDRLSRGVAAKGIIHLLHLNTHGLSPYLYAVAQGWLRVSQNGVGVCSLNDQCTRTSTKSASTTVPFGTACPIVYTAPDEVFTENATVRRWTLLTLTSTGVAVSPLAIQGD